MIINSSNLNILTQNVQVVFNKAYDTAPSDYLDKVATIITSGTKQEIYPMVAEIPQLREWVGDRQANDVATYDYTLTNKDFELTIKLDRNKVLDDQYGIWMQTVVPMIAQQAKRKPSLLVRDILRVGQSTACHDGQNFFDASHPVNKFPGGGFAGSTQQNYWSAGKALTFDNYRDVRAKMMNFRGESGERLNITPNLLVVPPQLEMQARLILNSSMVAAQTFGSDTNVGGYSNPLQGTAELLVLPDLGADATAWYLLDTSKPIKPFLYQKRQDPILVPMFNPNDESVYRRKEFEFGIDMRGVAGVSLWWMAAKAVA
jgi:phage major head subunit gpT-like protein